MGALNMHTIGVLLELLGAFFLAAEAIKTKNLVLLGHKLYGVASTLRRFQQADDFSFRMIGSLISIAVLGALYLLEVSVSVPKLMVIQLVSALSLIITVLSLEYVAKGLEWIERNTASGIVGISGFALYALGIMLREAA